MLLNEMLDRNVRCYPEAEAIVYRKQRSTYRDFGSRVDRLANALLALKVEKGDRVALLAKNSSDYLVSYFGITRTGAVAVPLNFRLHAEELAYIIRHSDARCLIVEQEFLEPVQSMGSAALQGLEHLIVMGSGDVPEGMLRYDELIDEVSDEPCAVEVHDGDVAIQMYTSGTTGQPKGAMLTHRNLATVSFMGFAALRLTSEGRTLSVAPLFHAGALVIAFSTILAGGANIVLEQFQPAEILGAFAEERITHSFFVPAMLGILLDEPGAEQHDYSSLQTLGFGGAPISQDLLVECRRVFQCELVQGFGQTEAATFVTTMSQEEYRRIADDPGLENRLRSVGKDFPGLHVRIVDDNDQDVPHGDVGEIIAKGDNVMSGYYKMPEETEKTLKGGWLHTGDMGKFDEEGYLYIVDRKKDMIISGGENIYSREVENVISGHQGVAEVAIVGVPDEKWGEVPRAFVVCVPGADLTEEGVIEYSGQHLAGFKCPKKVVFLDALPRNVTGKVLKRKLRKGS
jgi:long-chain acyl-CoA synthetase